MPDYDSKRDYYDDGRHDAKWNDRYDPPTRGWFDYTPGSTLDRARADYDEGWHDGGGSSKA